MRNLSPFPHKVEIKDPDKRIKYSRLDAELIEYIKQNTSCYTPLMKDTKRNLVQLWCNMMFGTEHWDFEEEDAEDDWAINYGRYWLCFKKEEYTTLAALKWN